MERKTYHATAHRTAPHEAFQGYAVQIHGLPDGKVGVTQGEDPDDALSMTRECIALLLDVDEDSFDVVLTEATR